MRILMLGLRGVPATYGGIERAVEESGAELVQRGHEVHVWCRRGYSTDEPDMWRGMHLHYGRTLDSKHLEAFVHTATGALRATRQGFDVVHFHALGPGLFTPVTRWLSTAAVVQTIHGLDDERAKWGGGAKAVLRTGRWLSGRVPHATVVVARGLADVFPDPASVHHVPNGVRLPPEALDQTMLEELGVEPGGYLLFVGRLVPEKAVDVLLRAFARVDTDLRLVIAGDASHTEEFGAEVLRLAAADPRVITPGFVYGDRLHSLYAHAAAFVLPSLLEGLPLVLLEAAAHGAPIVVSDIAPHLEVLGEQDRPGRRLARAGDPVSLADAIRRAIQDPVTEREGASAVRDEVLGAYSWPAVAAQLEDVYAEAVARARGGRRLLPR
jgi:glycosyltransferase involved in cell wall biosynthesis